MDLHAATELFQSAAAAGTAGRLAYLGLSRRFPSLLAYVTFIAASDLASGVLQQRSRPYFWLYLASTPLESIFNIFAVRELFTITFEAYPGIRTVGRWAMYSGIGVAATVSLVITKYLWDTGLATGLAKLIIFFNQVAQRSIVLTLAIIIATIIFALSKYPLHLGRNAYISCGFFSALFLSEAARLSIDGLAPGLYNNYADWTEAILTALLLAGWAIMLRPQEDAAAPGAGGPRPDEDQLLDQLKSLNDMMSRAGRR